MYIFERSLQKKNNNNNLFFNKLYRVNTKHGFMMSVRTICFPEQMAYEVMVILQYYYYNPRQPILIFLFIGVT